jgi:hypothetical protein
VTGALKGVTSHSGARVKRANPNLEISCNYKSKVRVFDGMTLIRRRQISNCQDKYRLLYFLRHVNGVLSEVTPVATLSFIVTS